MAGKELTRDTASPDLAFFITVDDRKVFNVSADKQFFEGIVLEHGEEKVHPLIDLKIFGDFRTENVSQNGTIVNVFGDN